MIDELVKHADAIRHGDGEVKPGQPIHITKGFAPGDGVWQGDLGLEVIEKVPSGYKLVKPADGKEKDQLRQLVPGNTQGARHCLQTLKGVKVYRRDDWGPNSLLGPVLAFSEPNVIDHPTHGPVHVPAGTMIKCRYQREWDAEQARERRSID